MDNSSCSVVRCLCVADIGIDLLGLAADHRGKLRPREAPFARARGADGWEATIVASATSLTDDGNPR